MRRWSELAERVAATTRTSEKTSLLADYLRTLDADELPIAVVFLTGRPFPEADQRATGIGWATIANALGKVGDISRGDLGAAYDRFSDISAAVGDALLQAGHDPDPAGDAGPEGRGRDVRGDRVCLGPGAQGRPPRRSPGAGGSEDRARGRPGPLGRAPDRAPRGARRGCAGEGLRPPARRREARRDAHRRHRQDGRARPRGHPRGRQAGPVPPAEVHARLARRGRGRDPPASRPHGLGRGQVRRHPLPAAPRGDERPPVLAGPPRHLRRLPGGHRGGEGPALGRHPRRRAPRLARRHGPAVHLAPDAARAEGSVPAAARGGPGHLRRLGRARVSTHPAQPGPVPAARPTATASSRRRWSSR